MGKKKNQQGPTAAAAEPENAAESEEKGGGGEEEEEKINEGDAGGGGKKKKNDEKKGNGGSITIVLKVDMHCEGCSKKIIKSIKGIPGLEAVKADAGSGTLTVVGKLDPWKLRDRVESKSHKKVDLVSPTNFPRKPANGGDPSSAAAAKKSAPANQPNQKKTQEKPKPKIVVTTVTLKLRLHCEGCIRRIRKTIFKIKGVEQVVFDTKTDQVTVTGTMDGKLLPETLKSKLKREVEVVKPKKDGGGGGGGGGEKKGNAAGASGGGGEKKNKGDGGDGGDDGGGGGGGGNDKKQADNTKAKAKAAAAAAAGAVPPNVLDYYAAYGYRVEMVHAPQLFSDENPNSCSVM